MAITARRTLLLVVLATVVLGHDSLVAEERWVTSIRTSREWAVFPCKDYWVTNVCTTDKDYADPGSLPALISVGDTVTYTDKRGNQKQFIVRHIKFFVYETNLGTRQRGDTTCSLFDAKTRSATRDSEYPSRLVVKDCRVAR